MKVKAIDPESPLFGYVRPGFEIKSINGQPVVDGIDFRFRTADERIDIVFADPKGKQHDFQFDWGHPVDLGLTLEDDRVMVCNNNCIFCFIHQQPKGMRRALYVKDEDYRLSFTHGNFITLTNVTEGDIQRIIEQRLSPLYVSVHATDNELRRHLLGNQEIAPILPRLKYLTENGITIHAQCVLCPGINDGEYLTRTIDDLVSLYPGVSSLAVVPVGLTRYRQRLPKLRRYNRDEAASIIDFIGEKQVEFLAEHGSRIVWAADEFYVEAGRSFPNHASYEEMPQFENGVGMAREFITVFNRRRSRLAGIKSRRRVMFLTGESALPFMRTDIEPYVRNRLKLNLTIEPVKNIFWGESVTVAGLLTGEDLLNHARYTSSEVDAIVLPPNCLNSDNLFLDNMSLDSFREDLGCEVIVGKYNLAETIREVFA